MSNTMNKFAPEVRERAVQLVLDSVVKHSSRRKAIMSIAVKVGCTPQTLNDWVKKAEVASGRRAGMQIEMARKVKALERENRELRQTNEILRNVLPLWNLLGLGGSSGCGHIPNSPGTQAVDRQHS